MCGSLKKEVTKKNNRKSKNLYNRNTFVDENNSSNLIQSFFFPRILLCELYNS